MRHRGAILFSSTLFLPSFERKIESDIFLYFWATHLFMFLTALCLMSSIPLVTLLFFVPLFLDYCLSCCHSFLSVFLTLFQQPVVHRPIFHPAPPACASCRLFNFLLSIFSAVVFLFPTSLSGSSIFLFFSFFFFLPQTDRAVS